mgnify:CR=1 FL=1
MKTLILLAALMVVMHAANRVYGTEYTWTNTTLVLTQWDADGSWSVPGFPRQQGDVAQFVDNDENTAVRTVELNNNDYYTCAVIRCLADTNRYTVNINQYVNDGLFLEAASGNAAIIVDDDFLSGTPCFTIAGHNLHIISPTDITVSNNTARMDITASIEGTAALAKYGPGQVRCAHAGSGYSGTIAVHGGEIYLSGPSNLHAATFLVKHGAWLQYDYMTLASPPVPANIILQDGWLYNSGNTTDGKRFDKLTVDGAGYITSKWYNTFFTGTIQGTGTLYNLFRPMYILGDVHPGFSIGTLTIRRQSGTIFVGTNTAPATLHIETSTLGSDRLVFENLDTASRIDLGLVNVVFEGTGTGAQTNWFLSANQLLNGSVFNSISNAPGLISEVVYDYSNNQIGVIAVPEPVLPLGLLAVVAVLRRR